ncbi:MAG: MATE family efflux transporter, partial [Atopobiaceae bacterium]|nr:MATE family efflux transporter [Atopobiaceae bacterium]
TLVLNTWIEVIAGFFIDDAGIISYTAHMTRVIAFFYLFYGMTENYSGMIRGAGESLRPMAITLTGTCVFRIVWLMVFLPLNHTLDMVLWSYPLSWALTALIYFFYYRFGHWLIHAEEHEAALLGVTE